MTFVGKVLVVVQLILSVCFMAFAAAVFTAQQNWRTTAVKAQDDAKKAAEKNRQDIDRITGELATMKTSYEEQKALAEANGAKLATAQNENTGLKRDKERLLTEVQNHQTQAQLAQDEATRRLEEAKVQRAENKTLHDSRDALLVQVRQLEDEKFAQDVSMKNMDAKHKQALEKLHNYEVILTKAGISTDVKSIAARQAPPPVVEGLILETRKGTRDSTEFVEISLGSDDGLFTGHELFVYREGQGKYLGKVRIEQVFPDRAVGTVVQKAKNGTIQKGDAVTSKL